MVTNGFSRRLFRIEQWRQAGYAVVMLDNRGSANRGVVFEGSLKVCACVSVRVRVCLCRVCVCVCTCL